MKFIKGQHEDKGRSIGFMIVSSLLLGLAAYAVVDAVVESYQWAGLAGLGVLILSVIFWTIVYGEMGL